MNELHLSNIMTRIPSVYATDQSLNCICISPRYRVGSARCHLRPVTNAYSLKSPQDHPSRLLSLLAATLTYYDAFSWPGWAGRGWVVSPVELSCSPMVGQLWSPLLILSVVLAGNGRLQLQDDAAVMVDDSRNLRYLAADCYPRDGGFSALLPRAATERT